METRNEFRDICLDAEETKNFIDNMIHSDEEALRRRDEFLAQCPDFKPDKNGYIIAGVDLAKDIDL